MEKSLFLALLISGLSGISSAYSRYYYFVDKKITWVEAQSYCRAKYTDLATVDNMEEMKQLMEAVDPKFSGSLWIGLNKVSSRYWGWSSGEKSTFRYWQSGQPWSPTGNADCVTMVTHWNGKWDDTLCDAKIPFMCHKAKIQRIVRLKITSGGQDLNDPAMKTAILNQIEKKLRSQGVGGDTTLSWRVKNGKVFHLDKSIKTLKKNKCV